MDFIRYNRQNHVPEFVTIKGCTCKVLSYQKRSGARNAMCRRASRRAKPALRSFTLGRTSQNGKQPSQTCTLICPYFGHFLIFNVYLFRYKMSCRSSLIALNMGEGSDQQSKSLKEMVLGCLANLKKKTLLSEVRTAFPSDTTYISCSLSRFKFPMLYFGQLYCFLKYIVLQESDLAKFLTLKSHNQVYIIGSSDLNNFKC